MNIFYYCYVKFFYVTFGTHIFRIAKSSILQNWDIFFCIFLLNNENNIDNSFSTILGEYLKIIKICYMASIEGREKKHLVSW